MRWSRAFFSVATRAGVACVASLVCLAGCRGAGESKGVAAAGSSKIDPPPAKTSSATVDPTDPAANASTTSSIDLPPKKAPRLVLHLVPLGDTTTETMTKTADALSSHAPLDVVVETAVAMPKSAESSEKGRYRAEKLLDLLEALPIDADGKHGKIMGVAELDIVTEKNGAKNWGILGLGAIDGRVSVISTYRMKRAFEKGGGAAEPLVRERLWKVSLHELGHTLGLDHCPVKGCIMEDGHGTVKTIDGETALCDSCAAKFTAALPKD